MESFLSVWNSNNFHPVYIDESFYNFFFAPFRFAIKQVTLETSTLKVQNELTLYIFEHILFKTTQICSIWKTISEQGNGVHFCRSNDNWINFFSVIQQGVVRLFIYSDYLTLMCIYIQGYTLVTPNSVSLTQKKMSEKKDNREKLFRFSPENCLYDQHRYTQTIK